MGIQDAMSRVEQIQSRLKITDPVPMEIKYAKRYTLPQGASLSDTPVFFNGWIFGQESRGSGNRRVLPYQIVMRLYVYDSDTDMAAWIATEFHEALIDALDDDVRLGLTVAVSSHRGSGESGPSAEVHGPGTYIVIESILEVDIVSAYDFG